MSDASKSKSLRERLKQATQAAILDAAEDAMAEEGVAAANMQIIAERAGTSVGTLYNYFENRNGLMRALLTARREELHGRLEEATKASSEGDVEERLTALVGAVLAQFEAHHRFFRIAVESEHVRPLLGVGESRIEARPAMRQIEERARVCVAAGVESGRLRADDVEIYASVLTGIIRAVLLQRLSENTGARLVDDTQRIVRLFLEGVGARR